MTNKKTSQALEKGSRRRRNVSVKATLAKKDSDAASKLLKRLEKLGNERAERVIEFIETLRVPDGADFGKLFVLRDWQKLFIYSIYSRLNEDELRVVRYAILTVARKNGKTALIAALVLVHLVGPESSMNAQIYSAAFERGQAALVYRACTAMIRQDAELHGMLICTDSSKKITDPETGSTYQALSAESRSKHGLNPTFVIIDELAQFGADRELYDVLTTSMGAQAEPLVIIIGTQAANDAALYSELIDYGRDVNSGKITDETYILTEYSVPMDCPDIWDEATWYMANPGLGDFRSLKEMRAFAARAKRSPSLERTFRNLYLNQRVAGESAFIAPMVWKSNGDAIRPDLLGLECYAALDLSSKIDLTSLVLVFPDRDEGKADVLPFFWTPKDTAEERTKIDRVPYLDWIERGLIIASPGSAIDYRIVAKKLVELKALYDIRAVAFDRWRIDLFKKELEDLGVEEDDIILIPHGQGFKDMSPAVDYLEEDLLANKFRHGMHPVLLSHAANAVVDKDPAGNRKLTKAKSFGRIDGLIALVMANKLMHTTADDSSVYKKRGLVVI